MPTPTSLLKDKTGKKKIKTIYSAKHGNHWIKIIDDIHFDVKQYQNFYNYVGYQFLPKLYEYSIIENEKAKFVMSYIKGKQISAKGLKSLFHFVCYKIFPSFTDWAILNSEEDILYYHTDLKPENFLVNENNEFMLIDIDSMSDINLNSKKFKLI